MDSSETDIIVAPVSWFESLSWYMVYLRASPADDTLYRDFRFLSDELMYECPVKAVHQRLVEHLQIVRSSGSSEVQGIAEFVLGKIGEKATLVTLPPDNSLLLSTVLHPTGFSVQVPDSSVLYNYADCFHFLPKALVASELRPVEFYFNYVVPFVRECPCAFDSQQCFVIREVLCRDRLRVFGYRCRTLLLKTGVIRRSV